MVADRWLNFHKKKKKKKKKKIGKHLLLKEKCKRHYYKL